MNNVGKLFCVCTLKFRLGGDGFSSKCFYLVVPVSIRTTHPFNIYITVFIHVLLLLSVRSVRALIYRCFRIQFHRNDCSNINTFMLWQCILYDPKGQADTMCVALMYVCKHHCENHAQILSCCLKRKHSLDTSFKPVSLCNNVEIFGIFKWTSKNSAIFLQILIQ